MVEKSENCIFCKIAKKEIEVPKEYEDESLIAFKDKNPQAPVHILIIPKAHIGKINDIPIDIDTAVMSRFASGGLITRPFKAGTHFFRFSARYIVRNLPA